MTSFYFDGSSPSPLVMLDSLHRIITLEHVQPAIEMERVARSICVQLGGRAMCANQPLPVSRLRETFVPER